MPPHSSHQVHDGRILRRDTVGHRRSDAIYLLEHFDKSIGLVLAGFDLSRVHAEGRVVAVHALALVRYRGDMLGEVLDPFC